ncbi:hypothetical protein [Corynebacterium pacaense]|uniref:hypothetical protein n=1 Tax=Corynebacterium pacaense TaxID=1816684 RepID=UPI0015C4A424|nr:hypothetical protein [Corynebacterium pacaense]
MTHVFLAPSVTVVRRGDTAIQFGLDATRSGVVELGSTELADALAGVLRGIANPLPVSVLVGRLRGAGVSGTAVFSLIDDLLAYGILREFTRRPVLLLGRGSLPAVIGELLESAGLTARFQLRHDSDAAFLDRDPTAPVVVINRFSHHAELSARLARRKPTVFSAMLIDARGVIGPARTGGAGPCLTCVELTRVGVDKQWHTLVRQQPRGPANPDPVVEAAVAARVVALLHRGDPDAGVIEELDPYTGTISRRRMSRHPLCPVCWLYSDGAPDGPGSPGLGVTAQDP